MDSEMHFGELEEAVPRSALRPDQNRHFAVCPYGRPSDEDLPVFIDLDALRQMEFHALSNLNVELGGVMLGGQYLDPEGRPFVLVTDVLQAEHYESTKGSFKFTHDTWSEITRQMATFPEELQIVGWYHTHPDWGVFLSGMDMFICENFFNKSLDVAFVIDPCRGDRGMFFWQQNNRGDKQRAAGFHVVASRFREDELAGFVQQLEEQSEMSTRMRSAGPVAGASSPVVHIVERNSSGLMTAVMGMLVMQFCLVALLAWRMGAVSTVDATSSQSQAENLEKVLTDWMDEQRNLWAADAKLQVVDQMLAQAGQGENIASEIVKRDQEIAQLRASLTGLDGKWQQTEDSLAKALREQAKAEKREKSLNDKLVQKSKALEEELAENGELKESIAKLGGDSLAAGESNFEFLTNKWFIISASAAGILILGLGGALAVTIVARKGQENGNESEGQQYDQPPGSRT